MTATHFTRFHTYRRLFCGLACLVAVLIAGNLYLVSGTVFRGVARERASEALETQQASMVALETQYLELSSGVTLERALALGFRDAAGATTFVHAQTGAPVVAVLH